jgi:hypothetical protein
MRLTHHLRQPQGQSTWVQLQLLRMAQKHTPRYMPHMTRTRGGKTGVLVYKYDEAQHASLYRPLSKGNRDMVGHRRDQAASHTTPMHC